MGFRFKDFCGLSLFLIVEIAMPNATAQITVQVHNSAGVSSSVLRQGEAEAARIFANAGIDVVWQNCPNNSGVISDCLGFTPNEFSLQIVSNGRTLNDSVFGQAFLGEGGIGKFCDIFFNRIEQIWQGSGTDPSLILGAVAAHELGHLLLGSNAHSPVGIMQPVWPPKNLRAIDMGTLLFTRKQAALMKARLARPGNSALVKPENPSQLFLRLRLQE